MKYSLILLAIILFSTMGYANSKVAVFEFDATGMDSIEAGQVTNFMRQRLAGAAEIQVLPTNTIDYSVSTVTTDNTIAIQLGLNLGADFIISASLGKIGDLFTIDAKIVQVSSGESVLKNGSYEGSLELFLINTVSALTDELIQLLQPTEKPPVPQPVTLESGSRWYKKWWLWAGVGSAAILGGVLAQGDGGSPEPEPKETYLPEPPASP